MTMQTGENQQGLKKIIDMTRMIAIVILLLHFYFFCYAAFKEWKLTSHISDQLLKNISHTGLFTYFEKTKLIALGFLLLSALGIKGRKSEKATITKSVAILTTGLIIYFISRSILQIDGFSSIERTIIYITITTFGFILALTGAGLITRVIKNKLGNEVFNTANESFPQEERLLSNEYSLNLPAVYTFKGKQRKSWINFINPFRGILIMGSPGSGKTYFIIENFLRQLVAKKMALFVFDHKYPELTNFTYNLFEHHKKNYPPNTKFYTINFDDLSRTNRCNPLHPDTLPNLTSAIDAARSLLMSMNRTWVSKQGDFFIESPINLLAAVIWFLRKYEDGRYCTLPHAIELLHIDLDKLLTILQTQTEIATLVNPFVQLYKADDMETLGNQVASVKIPLGRISTPEFYYVLSGNDFTLDLNDPEYPKLFCLGNNTQQQEALAPILSLFVDRLNKIINQPGKYPCAQVCDEFASIRAASIMRTIATGRSNKIITSIAVQDFSQLKLMYSKEEAEIIFNITGNIISGQVSGETAKHLSDRFAKIFQDRESMSINSSDTSISKSKQLELSVPASTISSLSSGEFVGLVADNPGEEIKLKAFHSSISTVEIKNEKLELPPATNSKNTNNIRLNYQSIKMDISDMTTSIFEIVLNDPQLRNLLVKNIEN
ncbi:YWFCY domain-containing protein [Pinibacter aurantiacus]|uniref:YWFCY domain-containing protein n=1 Tax=Pinibacter aurantiacus TaxID=2851599 RepID=A0A9E2S7L7_9BACT|nr:YWFCY domain-containing protein [Pinibacter aurantiacus]MBV4357356.1 YWFCY domain-containing protein [Pinibacter aurantiacus]